MAQGQVSEGRFFTFEANNKDFHNRKRAAKACLTCQKRKKRCTHTFEDQDSAEKETAENVLPQLVHKEPIKFVGDLNPESVMTHLSKDNQTPAARISKVGIWVPESKLQSDQFRKEQEAAAKNGTTLHVATEDGTKKQHAVQKYATMPKGRRTLTGHQKLYLQAIGALRVLPKETQTALTNAYIEHIDPLLQIIDIQKLHEDEAKGEASVWLHQAIALVACKIEATYPYLKLSEEGPVMDPIPFARTLHTGLDAALKADLESDRFTKVQIMTLMSLHNDGPGGVEESSMHLIMAIHDAQTIGLHINTPGRSHNDHKAMLWWTLWTLDKFNACLGGRPLVIADRDIDIGRPQSEQTSRSQTMAVWLALGDLLDKVIVYYRPVAPETPGWEHRFPSFEEMTEDVDLDLVHPQNRNFSTLR